MFIEFLTEKALKIVKSEGRKILKYEDVANSVTSPHLAFLSDLVPLPINALEATNRLKESFTKSNITTHFINQ